MLFVENGLLACRTKINFAIGLTVHLDIFSLAFKCFPSINLTEFSVMMSELGRDLANTRRHGFEKKLFESKAIFVITATPAKAKKACPLRD